MHRVLVATAIGLACLGGLALAATAKGPLGGRGVATTATILRSGGSGEDRWADVRYATAGGQQVVSRVAICHHQTYAPGNPLVVLYDSANPLRVFEKDMVGQPLGVGPILGFEICGGAVLAAAVIARRRRRNALVVVPPTVDPLDAELAQLLATTPAPVADDAPEEFEEIAAPELLDA